MSYNNTNPYGGKICTRDFWTYMLLHGNLITMCSFLLKDIYRDTAVVRRFEQRAHNQEVPSSSPPDDMGFSSSIFNRVL